MITRLSSTGWWGSEESDALVHETARLGRDVVIGRGVIVGPNVVIGDGTQIWHYVNIIRDVEIGEDVMVGFACQLDPNVHVGDRTRIQPYTVLGAGARVGRDVSIGPYVCLTNVPYPPGSGNARGVVIEDGAVLLSRVTILPGLVIGKHAVVSSCALVTKDVAAESWVMGSPARPYGDRKGYDAKREAWVKGQ